MTSLEASAHYGSINNVVDLQWFSPSVIDCDFSTVSAHDHTSRAVVPNTMVYMKVPAVVIDKDFCQIATLRHSGILLAQSGCRAVQTSSCYVDRC